MGIKLPRRKIFNPKMSAVVALFLLPNAGWSAPRQFDCELTTIEAATNPNFTQAEARPIVVTVDQEAKTIAVSQDGVVQLLDHVTFSQLTMNGYTGTVSLGMDGSSGNIVLQSYGPSANKTEFGACNLK